MVELCLYPCLKEMMNSCSVNFLQASRLQLDTLLEIFEFVGMCCESTWTLWHCGLQVLQTKSRLLWECEIVKIWVKSAFDHSKENLGVLLFENLNFIQVPQWFKIPTRAKCLTWSNPLQILPFAMLSFVKLWVPMRLWHFKSDLFPLRVPLTASLSSSSHAKIPIRILAST